MTHFINFEYLKKLIFELILTNAPSNVNSVDVLFEQQPNAVNTKMCILEQNRMHAKFAMPGIHNALRCGAMLADVMAKTVQK